MTDILIIAIILVALIIGCVFADYCVALFTRTVVDVSLGFPKNMRVQLDPTKRSEIRWGNLGMCRVGGTVTNTVYAATLDDGLAFEMRSTFGRNMMQTVLVPWPQVRLEATKDALFGGRGYRIHVTSSEGDIVNTVGIGLPHKKWLDDVTEKIKERGASSS
jgi:hypothetical protein